MAVQRFSHQREEIYRAVLATKEHPSAQMVYDTLKPRMAKLSLGTVYRNLHQMAEEGRLLELDGPDLKNLFAMTPYAWKTPKEGVEKLSLLDTLDTQIGFDIHHYKRI